MLHVANLKTPWRQLIKKKVTNNIRIGYITCVCVREREREKERERERENL